MGVFVHPQQYRGVMNASVPMSNSFSAIVAESFEYLLEESIGEIGKGALAKRRSPIHHEIDGSDAAEIAEDVTSMVPNDEDRSMLPELQVRRTFLQFSTTHAHASESVTQSSTEVHHGGLNPRRVC